MSRIRTIKPDFWTSEQIISCSPHARLLFIGLWNFADDNGVHPLSYVRLKAEVFPADDCTIENIKQWVGELIKNDLLREYAVDRKSFWIVTGWKQHQRIDKPTYKFPLPSTGTHQAFDDYSSNERRTLDDHSPTTPLLLADSSATEWKVMEGNGEEKEIREVFFYWQQRMNSPCAVLDKKRYGKITQALKLGYSISELKKAIDGCFMTPFNMGSNDRGQKYNDIGLILRDSEHIEKFVNNSVNPPSGNLQSNKNDLMLEVI